MPPLDFIDNLNYPDYIPSDDEWTHNLLIKCPDLNAKRLACPRVLMNENVPDSVVVGFEDLIPTLELQDHDDRHVLAAVIIAEAKIVDTLLSSQS